MSKVTPAQCEIASTAEAEAGTADDKFMTPERTKEAVEALGGLGAPDYISSEQTLTSLGSLTLAHGLGSTPRLVHMKLHCVTAEYGFVADDEIHIEFICESSTVNFVGGAQYELDSTNIEIEFGERSTLWMITSKTDNGRENLTNANWRLIVEAWA